MLQENKLNSIIVSNISGLKDSKIVNNIYAASIKQHILEDSLLKGIYIGVLPNGSPDPLNGVHNWKCTSCELSSNNFFSAIHNVDNSNDFVSKFSEVVNEEIKSKTIYSGSAIDGAVIIGETKIVNIHVKIDMSSKPDKVNDSNLQIAKAIIDGITSCNPQPSIAATTAAGKGTVTFINIV